jgi:hypothetical protein
VEDIPASAISVALRWCSQRLARRSSFRVTPLKSDNIARLSMKNGTSGFELPMISPRCGPGVRQHRAQEVAPSSVWIERQRPKVPRESAAVACRPFVSRELQAFAASLRGQNRRVGGVSA